MYEDYQNQKKQQDSIDLFPIPQQYYHENYYRPQPIQRQPQRKKKKQQRKQPTYNIQRRPRRKNEFVEGLNRINTQGRKTHTTAGAMLENFTKLTMLVGVIALGIIGLKAYLDNLNIKDLEGNVYGGGEGGTSAEYDNSTEKGRIKNKIIAEAKRQGVDPSLALALAEQESGFNPKAKSGAGAMGLFQLMPDTAKSVGVTDPYDIDQNIKGGIKYLKWCLDNTNTTEEALVAYNAGIGNLQKAKKAGKKIDSITDHGNYAASVMGRQNKFKNELQQMTASSGYKSVDMGSITKAKSDGKGVHYDEGSNITSHTKLTTGTNDKYNANVGNMGTFDGYTITSGIGHRSVTGGSSFHRGLDLGFAYGTPVKAFCSGTVTHCGTMNGFGRCIIINDKNGYRHVYGHLSAYNVSNGQKVKKGQVIGKSGNSGTVKGKLQDGVFAAHLHYGIWKKGGTSDKKDYIDPRTYVYPPEGDEVPQTQSANDKVNKGNTPVTPSTQKPTTQNPTTKINNSQPTTQKPKQTNTQPQTIPAATNNKKSAGKTVDIANPDPIKSRIAKEDKKYKK